MLTKTMYIVSKIRGEKRQCIERDRNYYGSCHTRLMSVWQEESVTGKVISSLDLWDWFIALQK